MTLPPPSPPSPPPALDAKHHALTRLRAIGIANLLDASIAPRASPNGLIHARKVRIDEPDTRVLELHEWPPNLLFDVDRLAQACERPARVKEVLLRCVRERQTQPSGRLRRKIRLNREVHAADIQMAMAEVRGEGEGGAGAPAAAGEKRKLRVDSGSPLGEPGEGGDGDERQPMRKMKRVRFDELVLGVGGQRASPTSTTTTTTISSSRRVERPVMDTSVSLRAHAPNNDALAAFERKSHQCYMLIELLIKDLDRLDEIKRLIGPKTREEDNGSSASETSATFASHLIASARLSDATRDMDGSSAAEFVEHYRLRVEDERTHLDHQRAVVEASARKLCKHIREKWSPPLCLNKDLQKRIKALLN
ncbi:uncharacterized protein J3D65DRAFT_672014 [Phyllosticta citribraziliensis]|uniref:Uncharacterized protein n=1 Tax=Phyllosticta citribraziliensis TaxID=989973 RepID=A0ABR1L4S0_9PEZI